LTHLSQQVLLELVILDESTPPELPDLAIKVFLLTSGHSLRLDGILKNGFTG
jgi:hypothetical protein